MPIRYLMTRASGGRRPAQLVRLLGRLPHLGWSAHVGGPGVEDRGGVVVVRTRLRLVVVALAASSALVATGCTSTGSAPAAQAALDAVEAEAAVEPVIGFEPERERA